MSEQNYNSLFHPEARLELLNAIEYYRERSPELAKDFYEEINAAIDELLVFPESAPIVHPIGIRRKVLRRFPFNILYAVDPDVLYIVAIAHQKRRPDYWIQRLGLSED